MVDRHSTARFPSRAASMVALAAGILAVTGCSGERGERAPSEAATPEFAGSQSCIECHQRFYDLWAPSLHGLAMQPFTAELANAEILPQEEGIVVGEYRYRAELDDDGGWVRESGPDGDRRYRIEQAMGGKNVYYFLTPLDRGRLQVLPVAFDVRARQWFDTTASGVRHFPGEGETEAWHWTDVPYTFNTSCYSCHVSQLSVNYDLETDTYDTVWAEPGINCETCHGPASEHVRVFREAAEGETPEELHLISTRLFSIRQNNDLCAPCHARMSPLSTDFSPGDRFFDHFDLVGLEDPDFYPDGRDLGENYTQTSWLMSPCVVSGQLGCLHCHTSSGRWRQADDPNQSCAPCHGRHVFDPPAHSHHEADSEGSLCVSCHMPTTQFAQMRRSDHSMLPPAPAATLEFGSPNACNLCHDDRDAEWADRFVREWRQRDYQAPILERGAWIAAARDGDWSLLPEILQYLQDDGHNEIFAASLVRLVEGSNDARKWPVLIGLLADPSPLVRSSAAQGLAGNLTAEAIDALAAATRDSVRLVRIRAAGALASVPPQSLRPEQRGSVEAATSELVDSLISRPDDALSHYNMGNHYLNQRQFDRAVAAYETATRLRPDLLPPLINLAHAYNFAGQPRRAEDSLRRALELVPDSAVANLNLGLLLGGQGRTREAQEALRAALATDPQLAVAAYNLCVLAADSSLEEAVQWCRRAAELRPDEPRYAYTLAFYLRQSRASDEAISILEDLIGSTRGYADAYLLLGQIYEETERLDDARQLYRRALDDQQLDPQVRHQLAARLQSLQ